MSAFNYFKSVREYLTPVLQQSAFLEHGMLTPEEFVQAGDHLIRTCPTWRWECGEVSKRRPYLPSDKQYLTTTGVPCYRRVNDLESANYIDQMVESGGEGDDWCSPQLVALDIQEEDGDLSIIGSETLQQKENLQSSRDKAINSKIKDDEYLDMEDDSLALDESAQVALAAHGDDSNIIKSRRYDVSITYDNYYRTPRIWLYGYNENGSPLSTEQIFEDVMQDYAKKTVTVDPHPHLSRQHASIHPCKHSAAMMKIIETLRECEQTPSVEQYLFVFLKFIQSVVPTIEYDYTIDVQTRRAEA